ncbi:hypothetical protein KFK09_004662 [Dendrobium nobile]|uniref:Uncharacterized protein n=1 Tax=Dendrobium nobile TaxID=94219 RepID=A0A8T3C1A5_DENNO|nr:hypothetical protein KFK09_004662 [Dendrobium nobile]
MAFTECSSILTTRLHLQHLVAEVEEDIVNLEEMEVVVPFLLLDAEIKTLTTTLCQICNKMGHSALRCWYRTDPTYSDNSTNSTLFFAQMLSLLFFNLCVFPYYCNTLHASRITHLPGFNGSLPFYLETGYVTVNEKSGAELFYYFVESDRKPKDDPLILWLIGGPYCSGFIGFALDIGPLKFNVKAYDGTLPTLISNPYSWTKISSIIFLDWPVGTGFSFSRSMVDYHTDDVQSTKQIYKFLIKWLLAHPSFQSNPFYVGGDSYGGKMVPLLALEIFLSEINMHEILKPKCADDSPIRRKLGGNPSIKKNSFEFHYSVSMPDIDCANDRNLSYYWSNDNLAKEALHIKEVYDDVLKQSNICNCEVHKNRNMLSLPFMGAVVAISIVDANNPMLPCTLSGRYGAHREKKSDFVSPHFLRPWSQVDPRRVGELLGLKVMPAAMSRIMNL